MDNSLYRTHKIATYLLAVIALALLVGALCAGCATPLATGAVYVGGQSALPPAFCAYDGNTLVAWGAEGITGELYSKDGTPILPPVHASAGEVIVRVRQPKFEWRGHDPHVLPPQAQTVLKPEAIAAWGITFSAE